MLSLVVHALMKVANIAKEIHNPHGHCQTPSVKSGALFIRFAKW